MQPSSTFIDSLVTEISRSYIQRFLPRQTDPAPTLALDANRPAAVPLNLSPLQVIMACCFSLFLFIYFSNEFMCTAVGLFYPAYRMYLLLTDPKSQALVIYIPVLHYSIIYTHITLAAITLGCFDLYLYHLRLALILFVLYLWACDTNRLASWYDAILFYDRLILRLGCNIWARLVEEYQATCTSMAEPTNT